MVTPDDARNSMAAAINQVPAAMEATRHALGAVTSFRRTASDPDHQVLQLLGVLVVCVAQLDNRIERLEGRTGVPLEQLVNLLREFGFDNG
jgi:hypothetical protein